jgi:hypothetical protein
MSDAGGRIPVRTAKQISNNFFGHRISTRKNGGTIPLRLLENRYERTNYNEDPEVLNRYLRKSAKFNGPDPILWEHDAPSYNRATNAGLLNLRLGGSLGTKADQNHSEMFLGFSPSDPIYGKDPRGTNEDPDFRNARKHMERRGKQYVKGMPKDKSEDIIIDTGNIYRPIKDKRDTFYPTKDRLRIFSTTLDSMPNQKQKEISTQTHKLSMKDAAMILPVNELEDAYRSPDYTTVASNNYMDNYFALSVADHRIPVARYGDTSLTPHLSSLNIHGERTREQHRDHKVKDEMSIGNGLTFNTLDPRLMSGIYTRLADSDMKVKDSADGVGVAKNEIKKDIDRFISELTKTKSHNSERESSGLYNTISYEGNSMNDMLIKTTTDAKVGHKHKDVRDEFSGNNMKTKNVDSKSLFLLQTAEKKHGNGVGGEEFARPYKYAHINVLSNTDGAVYAAQQQQLNQNYKYQGLNADMETVSYKDAPAIGNIHEVSKVMDIGDIDFYDSTWAKKRAGRRDPFDDKFRDENIVAYDAVSRGDNVGDDGKYISNKKVTTSSRQKHMTVTNLESNSTMKESDYLNRATPSKKYNKSQHNMYNDAEKTRRERVKRVYES